MKKMSTIQIVHETRVRYIPNTTEEKLRVMPPVKVVLRKETVTSGSQEASVRSGKLTVRRQEKEKEPFGAKNAEARSKKKSRTGILSLCFFQCHNAKREITVMWQSPPRIFYARHQCYAATRALLMHLEITCPEQKSMWFHEDSQP